MGEIDIRQWFVIVNPTAGNGRGLELFPQISRQMRDLGIIYEPVFTEHKYHAVELTVTAIKQGYRKLLVVGGDGTLHEVVNGLFIQQAVEPKEVTVGAIAVGEVNNWARGAGVPLRTEKAVALIHEEHTKLQDVGVISYEEAHYPQTRYMVNAGGVGFNTYVLKKLMHQRNKGNRGGWKMIWTLTKAFFRYKPTGVKVWIDDKLVYNNLLMSVAIGVGRYNAGGMLQLPNAVSDDGQLDLSLVKPIHFWHIMFRLSYFYNGGIYRIGHIQQARGAKIRIDSTPEISLEIDGEMMGESPFEFSVLQQAITVVVPKDQHRKPQKHRKKRHA